MVSGLSLPPGSKEVAMSSIQNVSPTAPSTSPSRFVPTPSPAPRPQVLPVDTVTVSLAGRAASRGYLQSAIQLAEDSPQQVVQLAGGGNAQAQAFLAREAYSRILFS